MRRFRPPACNRRNKAASVGSLFPQRSISYCLLAENPAHVPLILNLIVRYLRNAQQLPNVLSNAFAPQKNGPTVASNASGAVTAAGTFGVGRHPDRYGEADSRFHFPVRNCPDIPGRVIMMTIMSHPGVFRPQTWL